MDRQTLIRVLADPSRHAVFEEVSGRGPASIGEIAERLELHPNTVRLHLEKLRDAGLVDSAPDRHGSVGRPHHLWSVRDDAPALDMGPAGLRTLAHLLADLAALDPALAARAVDVGRRRGRERAGLTPARDTPPGPAPADEAGLGPVIAEMAALGFDPEVGGEGSTVAISFTSCPFREVAAVYPELVCRLHQGLTEGLLAGRDGGPAARLSAFSTLVDRDPCRAEVTIGA
ncbi:MAG TPA: helix-turn-helix domain-containing protein [Acidimicrobiales bacterium]|nr:helix-turn-helix domain-containing protein [Acidimicrobiales bacterium]